MMMFFRKFGDKLSDFITHKPFDKNGIVKHDPRVTPWDLGYDEDFGYILRHSKKMRIINPQDLANLHNISEVKLPTIPETHLFVPYGDHMVALEHKNNAYAFPYVILSERPRDCRLLIFEDVQHLIQWMWGLGEDVDLDKWNRRFLNKMRVVRLLFNGGELLVEDSLAANDIYVDTTGWSKKGSKNRLTRRIININDPELDIPVLKSHLLMLSTKPAFVLDHNEYFIKEWRYNGK